MAALFFLPRSGKGTWLSIGACLIAALLFVPWVQNSPYYTGHSPSSWMQPPGWSDIKKTLIFLFGSEQLLIAFLTLSLLPLIFLILKKIPKDVFPRYMTALLLFVVPVTFNFLVSVYLVPILLPKYVLYASLGLIILTGYTLSLGSFPRVVNYMALALLLFASMQTIGQEKFGVEQWRETAHEVRIHKTDRTMVIISPQYQYVSFAFYYNSGYFRSTDSTMQLLNAEKIFAGSTEKVILEQPTDYDEILLLTSHEGVVDPSSLVQFLQKKFLQYMDSSYLGVRMYGFRKFNGLQKFNADMEAPALGFQMNNIKENVNAHSGKKVSFTDGVSIYSTAFVNKIGAFNKATRNVKACGWVYRSNPTETGLFVTSLDRNNTSYQYQATDISEPAKPGEWVKICCDLEIPRDAKQDDIVKFYFWNKGNSVILIDDMEITEQ
jgi:hypothetical protein